MVGFRMFTLFSCGQSYKHFMIVINDPRVVTWAISQSYDSRVVNYDRKVLCKIDHRMCSSVVSNNAKFYLWARLPNQNT